MVTSKNKSWLTPLLLIIMAVLTSAFTGCFHYGFNSSSPIADSIRYVRVNMVQNHAPYLNPSLAPALVERLKQKIVRQTKLSQSNDNPDLDIYSDITDYSVTTSGITSENGRSQTSINRLTVSVHVRIENTKSSAPPKEFDVSRSFDFAATLTLQAAESTLLDEMVRNLADEIFNKLFSDW
jgi:hypothetical protein